MGKSKRNARSSFSPLLLAAKLMTVLLVAVLFLAAANKEMRAADENGAEYNLATESNDSPREAKLKAALRLLSAYSQVQNLCAKCGEPSVMKGYAQANGSTLAKAIKVIQINGGQNERWKAVLRDDAKSSVQTILTQVSCEKIISDIRQGRWALYDGRFKSDYMLVSGL
ncbi:MAG: hypothetical protein LBJ64_13205 [Deltaproteobacteria bacterium]|jgi:hypothetical protein|nr:hypothetical protein [Deltaproteobacteria bacterium]